MIRATIDQSSARAALATATPTVMDDYRFPKSRRLLKSAEFERVFARRTSRGDHVLVVYARENNLTHSRLGLVVSRKVGDAATRNLWKRRLREAFRLAQHELPAGLDLVVLPRGAKAVPARSRLDQSLRQLARRLAADLPPPAAGRPSS